MEIDNHLRLMTQILKLSDIINKQAIFNCGTAGHVSHGKSTVVHKLTGTRTQKYSKEQEKNITIKLGYANCKFYLNTQTNTVHAFPSGTKEPVMDPDTDQPLVLLSTVSFVDCPGHELYMATMVSGSKIMDYAMVVIAANEQIPRPQTHHHIIALDYSHIEDLSFVLNKLDLVKQKDVQLIKGQLDTYLQGMDMSDRMIHPISAATGDNVQELCQFLAAKVYSRIPKTIKQSMQPLKMNIVRSYNVNRPNTPLKDLVGAVVGGTIETGILTVGDQIELRPGVITMKDGQRVVQPLVGYVEKMESDHNQLQTAIPGGLVGVNLSIYAGLSNDDHLKGQVLGHVGTLPNMYDTLKGRFRLFDIRTPGDTSSDSLIEFRLGMKVDLVVNGISNVSAEIVSLKTKTPSKGSLELRLKSPVVLDMEHGRVAIMYDRKLVASFSCKNGSMSLPIVYPDGTDHEWLPQKYEIVNDLVEFKHTPPSFEQMASQIGAYRQKRVKRETYYYPDVTKINRSVHILEQDFDKMVNSMTYNEEANAAKLPICRLNIGDLIVDNLESEFHKSSPRFNGEGNLTMNGFIRRDQMNKFVDKFVAKILTCPSCKGTKSTLCKIDGKVTRHCHNCPAVTGLHTTNIGRL